MSTSVNHISSIDIPEIVNLIKNGNVGFFYGAGMSFNAGIPTVSVIIEKILHSFQMDEHIESIKQLKFPFEAYMEILRTHMSIDEMLDIFNSGNPTKFHQLLKHLNQHGYVKNIMTTNFDLLLEKSGIMGLEISINESQFSRIHNRTSNYIKIHGCVSNKESIRTTIDSIAKRELKDKRKTAVEKFFRDWHLSTIFIMGYSCSDKMDITPFLRSIHDSSTRIVFIQHQSNPRESIPEIPYFPFEFFNCNLYVGNTTELVDILCQHFNVPYIDGYDKIDIDKYFLFNNPSMELRQLVVAYFYFRNCEYNQALFLLNKIEENTYADLEVKCDAYVLRLEIHHRKGDYNERKLTDLDYETFEKLQSQTIEAEKVYHKIFGNSTKYLNKVGQLYNHWGHLLLSMNLYNDAIKSYRKAYRLFKDAGNDYRQNQIINNYGNVYLHRYNNSPSIYPANSVFNAIYKLWSKSMSYYDQTGYLLEQAISKQNMAELLYNFNPNQINKCRTLAIEAKNLYEYLNDNDGVTECDSLINKIIADNYE